MKKTKKIPQQKLLQEIERRSLLFWIKRNNIKNENSDPIEFKKHRFMIDLYRDRSKTIVIRKSSQVGASTFAILKEIHDAKYWGINQIHTLPSDRDVWEFVPTKVDKILKVNGIKLDKDSVEIKGIGKGFIYFKGTFTEKSPIIITSDRNVYDEVDKSKMSIIGDYNSRMAASKMGEEIYISTPTIPNFGIDELFSNSDQKYWRFNCPHCNYRQHMEWDANIDYEKEAYVCSKCRKEITPEQIRQLGEWEARYPNREIRGYWINQMMCWDAKHLIKEYNEASEGLKGKDLVYFYNFVLGLPYLSKEKVIPRSLFLKNISNEQNSPYTPGLRNIMGADIGLTNHIILGNEKGIWGIAEIKDEPQKDRWDRMAELMDVYDVKIAIIDAMPETAEAYRFAKRFPYKVYLQFFKDDPKIKLAKFNDEEEGEKELEDEMKVFVNRTRAIDELIKKLEEGKEIRFNFQPSQLEFQELIEHAETMYAQITTDKFGQDKKEWLSTTGKNHYWMALLSFWIALRKLKYWYPGK